MKRGFTTSSPFPQRPLVWGAPPPSGAGRGNSAIAPPSSSGLPTSAPGDMLNAIVPVSFAFSYNNGAITTAFPSGLLYTSYTFQTACGLISATLSTSLVNASSNGVLAIFLSKVSVNQTLINANQGSVIVSHLVEAGLSHSMRSGMAFADDVSPRFGVGESLGIYIASAGTGSANNRASGVVELRFFQDT